MQRISSTHARAPFSASPALTLFFSLLCGVLCGVVLSSRPGSAAQLISLPVSVAGRTPVRSAIVAFLVPLTVYLFALCFGTLPTALLFFCKGTLLSCLLYPAARQGVFAQTVFLLLFHSLLPLPMQLCAAASLLSREESRCNVASPLLVLAVSSIFIFLAELCLARQ